MTELPQPDAAALAHSRRLQRHLIERIQQQGDISFADYMHEVLYSPGMGYYMAGARRFGAGGDFITAPELSPLFAAAMAHEALEILVATGGGILELGAGSGALASELLLALPMPEAVDYWILEPSADLVAQQQQQLKQSLPPAQFARVRWLRQLPDDFQGLIIANEVMDALPVECFTKQNGKVAQLAVDARLQAVYRAAPARLCEAVAAIELDIGREFEDGYRSEACLWLAPWLQRLSRSLQHGVILLIDYGYPRQEYYLAERSQGTLACYYRHRSHDDALRWPGLQDITAHVDFTAVADSAVASGLDLLGYASQAAWLIDNNLLVHGERAINRASSERDRLLLAQQMGTLTLPGKMGERFQVMALARGYDRALAGFRSQDLTHRL